MIRVVQVGFHLDRAGRSPDELLEAWPTLPGLASAVARAGTDVVVVQPARTDRTLERDGVTYHFVAESSALFRRGTPGTRPVRSPAGAVVDAVADLAPDVVHVNGLTVPGHAGRLKARLPRGRIVVQDHADRPPPPWRRPLAGRAMRAAYDAAVFTAREQAEPFFEAGLFPRDLPVYEVPEASTDFGPADPDEARQAAGVHGDPCLVWLGHLDANKDPLTVLDGLSRAALDLPDPHLWCVYRSAPLMEEVRRRIEEDPDLDGRVHLLGPRAHPDVETLLQGAHALVQGSHREGSGYAVIEAMACGAPPVVTDIPSFRTLTGEVGRLWPPGDAEALAEVLRSLAPSDRRPRPSDGPTDPTNGANRAPSGPWSARRDRVLRHFEAHLSWDAVGRRMAAVYRDVLDRGGVPT